MKSKLDIVIFMLIGVSKMRWKPRRLKRKHAGNRSDSTTRNANYRNRY